jgi:hypothetical protein
MHRVAYISGLFKSDVYNEDVDKPLCGDDAERIFKRV